MNEDWKKYLAASGAIQDDSGMTRFNDLSAVDCHAGNFICDLSHFSTVVVAGPDAIEFMQYQRFKVAI